MDLRSQFILGTPTPTPEAPNKTTGGLISFFKKPRVGRDELLPKPGFPIEIKTLGVDLQDATNLTDNLTASEIDERLPAVFFGIGDFQHSTGFQDADTEREITTIDIYAAVNKGSKETLVERVGDMISLVEMAVKEARNTPPPDINLMNVRINSGEVDRGNPSKVRFIHFEITYLYQYRL